MKKLIVNALVAAVSTVMLAGAAFAGPNDDPAIQQREREQQRRIRQGVRSGQLTPAETARLEREQRKIRRDEQRAKADGKMTPRERRRLQMEQDKASRDIYREKHDAQRR